MRKWLKQNSIPDKVRNDKTAPNADLSIATQSGWRDELLILNLIETKLAEKR